MTSAGVAQEPSSASNVGVTCPTPGVGQLSSGVGKPQDGGSSPPPGSFDKLVDRLVWCSYMMHTYDGFNAGDVP